MSFWFHFSSLTYFSCLSSLGSVQSGSVAFKDGPRKPGPAGIRPLKRRRRAEDPSNLGSVPPKEIQKCHIL